MASNSSQHEDPPSSRLADFQCGQPKKGYAVASEWIRPKPNYPDSPLFDVAAVLANDESYERFVSQVRLDHCKVYFPNGDVFLCGGNGNGTLQIKNIPEEQLSLQVDPDARQTVRFVFTPSFSRYQGRSSQCLETLGKQLLECKNTVGVLMVREEQFSAYHELFRKEWFVMAHVHGPDVLRTQQATVGQARHSIMNVARSWNLGRIWMIDDSVPVNELRTCTTSSKIHKQISMLDALEEVETFAKTNRAGEGDAGPLALVGIPETYSVTAIGGGFGPQWNYRAATSFVYVMVQACESINYDPRLPYKEDIIFSARLIEAGKSVCVYRQIHFEDKPLAGGCQQYHQATSLV